MTQTGTWRLSRRLTAADGACAAPGGRRRAGGRLWALLNAQALLNDRPDGAGGGSLIEDDRRRLGGRRDRCGNDGGYLAG